ncbi:hypothetical protein AA313_de0207266 [Arthrobotrys entomopaga]|nr:hypothetical protein AA313_de0207266 [Arthrobotrys entomopaga]
MSETQKTEKKPAVEYPHPLDIQPTTALSYHDSCLRRFSSTIRNKPNWTDKVTDRKLMAKWIREAAIQDARGFCQEHYIVPIWDSKDIEFIHSELVDGYKPYVEKLREGGSCIEPDIDAVWRADELIDEELRNELINAVATLENIPDEQKDWHPGSGNQVLDLVHPSLWPVIYDRSINIDDGQPIKCPQEANIPANPDSDYSDDSDSDEDANEQDDRLALNGWSRKFCWLPSEFTVAPDRQSTKITSYINNLSTADQKELFYPILERIFTKFVPMFNHLLADLASGRHDSPRTDDPWEFSYEVRDYHIVPLPITVLTRKWNTFLQQYESGEKLSSGFTDYYNLKHYRPRTAIDKTEGEEGDSVDSWGEIESDTTLEEEKRNEDPYLNYEHAELWGIGELRDRNKWKPPIITDEVKLDGKVAKVIVKMANIVLTPENPTYAGGSWHVEAMKNERIIATGIYYYAQENITDSTLSFRRTVRIDQSPQWNDSYWGQLHGMGRQMGIQEIGEIKTKENRAMVFPNVFQHCVSSFQLKDPTKPGYRKILVFFLCDPNHDVPTTRMIAPQQPEQRIDLERALREGPLGKLPEEIFQTIVKELPPLIPLEEAHRYREWLMSERSRFTWESSKVQGRCYNL